MRRSALARSIGSGVAVLLGASVAAPELIVPAAPDLLVKTCRAAPGQRCNDATELLYLKGARQRHESHETLRNHERHSWIAITQCDERRMVRLNDATKLYAFDPIVDPEEYVRR